MASKRIAHIAGVSASGTAHGLLIEASATNKAMVTITGADGKKRHATSIVQTGADIDELIAALQTLKGIISA